MSDGAAGIGSQDAAEQGVGGAVAEGETGGVGGRARGVAHPDAYAWFVLVGSLDLMLTNFVMTYFGAREVNTIADRAINLFGFWGLIGLKFACVTTVIAVCEVLARRAGRVALSRRIIEWGIAIQSVPVVVALTQVVMRYHL